MPIQKKATLISLITSLIVLYLKTMAYQKTQSMALFSDALETVINVVTAIIAIFVIRFSLEPADDEHPYGHGKIEHFSASFEGGLVFFAGLAVIYEGVKALLDSQPVHALEVGLIYTAIATAFNFATGFFLVQAGEKNSSPALKANGIHMISDVKTTVGIFIGLIIYKFTNWHWIDSVLAIVVGFWLLKDSIVLIKDNVGHLLDKVDLDSVDQLAEKINIVKDENIIDVHNLKIIRSGQFHHIDAHLVMPEFYDVKKAHELLEDFEKKVLDIYHFDGEFAFHTDPCLQLYCEVCNVPQCPIRKKTFKKITHFTGDHLVKGPQYGKESTKN